MRDPDDDKDQGAFDETVVLDDGRRRGAETEPDPDQTAVLGEEYRREIQSGRR